MKWRKKKYFTFGRLASLYWILKLFFVLFSLVYFRATARAPPQIKTAADSLTSPPIGQFRCSRFRQCSGGPRYPTCIVCLPNARLYNPHSENSHFPCSSHLRKPVLLQFATLIRLIFFKKMIYWCIAGDIDMMQAYVKTNSDKDTEMRMFTSHEKI